MIPAFVLFVAFFSYGGDYWHSKWSVMLALMVLPLGWRLAKGFTPSAGACFTWTALSSLYLFTWRDSYLNGFSKIDATSMELQGAYAYGAFLTVCAFFSTLTQRHSAHLREAFRLACLSGSLFTICQWVVGRGVGGFFDQYSINACFLAVTLPFVLELRRPWAVLPVVAIILTVAVSGTRSVFLVGFAAFAVYFFYDRRPARARLLRISALVLVLVGVFLALFWGHPLKLYGTSGRGPMIRAMYEWLFRQDAVYSLFGLGQGSFQIFGNGVQKLVGFDAKNGYWFYWLHSDWFQLPLEQGFIGLGLYLWLAWDCLRLARGDRSLLAALSGFGVTCLIQYPFRLPLFSLLGGSLIFFSLNRSRIDSHRPKRFDER